jgi:hypothetical protein
VASVEALAGRAALVAAAVGAIAIAGFSGTAYAGIEEASAGVSIPQPLGSASETITRPASFAASVWAQTPTAFPNSVEFNVAFEYLPYRLKNASSDNSTQLNLNMIGGYAGLTLWGGASALGIRPYISTDIGVLYDFLTIPSASGTISNTGTAFALRAAPGIDLPIYSHVGLLIELPITVAFFKSTLGIWQSTFALRWKL